MRRIATTVTLFVLLAVTSVAAQQAYTGTVLRIDPGAGVILFQDGRMLQTTADTVIIGGNQRTALHALTPGTHVTVYSAQPVALRDGRYYVVMSDPGARGATGTVVVPPPPPTGTILTTPGATTVVTQPVTESTIPAFEVSGHVLRADHMGRVIHMRDGRKVHLTEDTQVLLNGIQPVLLSTLAPDSYVVVRSVRPFAGGRGEMVPMSEVARGTVVRVEQPGVLVLNDGRAFRTTPETVVYVDRRPVAVSTLQPGTRVVVYQDGSTLAVVSDHAAASPALVPEAGIQQKENERQGGGSN